MEETGPWTCDTCGDAITKPQDGMVQWLTRLNEGRRVSRNLRIVHHMTASPHKGAGGCYPDERAESRVDGSSLSDMHLKQALGHNGLIRLLQMHEEEGFSASEINQVILRLFVPGHEKARLYADRAITHGFF